MTDDAPAADRLAALLLERFPSWYGQNTAAAVDPEATRRLMAHTDAEVLLSQGVRLAASGAPPREPSEAARAIEELMKRHGYVTAEAQAIGEIVGPFVAAPRAPRAPDGPWTAQFEEDDDVWVVSCPRRTPGRLKAYCYFAAPTETEAIEVRDALNRVAGAAPPEEPPGHAD